MVQTAIQTKISPLFNQFLLEAIFEIRWELQGDPQTGRFRDPAYPMMYGRMYEHLKNEFPMIEDLPTVQGHPDANPYVVRHRLRKEQGSLPLIQIGPGILTINDTKGYSWLEFKDLVLRLTGLIDSLYPKSVMPLNFIKAELRYINGIPCSHENPLGVLSEKLHIDIGIPQDLLQTPSPAVNVGLNLAYPLSQPVGHLLLGANLGQMDENPAYILQTAVVTGDEAVPQELTSLDSWLTSAHEASDTCFQSLCKDISLHEVTTGGV